MASSIEKGSVRREGVGAGDVDFHPAGAFPCLMDIGEAMLKCGADVHTIEQTLVSVGKAYGADRMNVLVITAAILVTVTFPDGYERTFSRRVVGEAGTDFSKLEALSNLCAECIENPLPVDELQRRLDDVKSRKFPDADLFLGGVLSAGGFAVFFGGSLLDGLAAAVFALFVCVAIKHFKPLTPNPIVFNFATSVVVGVAIAFVAWLLPSIDMNMVIIGVIMLLIPGVAMTNATRDMLSGDTISGVMRFVESLLWATSLALGFMTALWIAHSLGWYSWGGKPPQDWPIWMMIPITVVSSLGFALFFGVRNRHVAIATLGGLLTWLVYDLLSAPLGGIFVPCLTASAFAAIYAEILSRRFKVPNAVFFIIAVIPLVPGRGLYYTMYNAVSGNTELCLTYGFNTLMFAAGIAVGICLIAAVMQTWDIWKSMHEKAAMRIENAGLTAVHAAAKVGEAVAANPVERILNPRLRSKHSEEPAEGGNPESLSADHVEPPENNRGKSSMDPAADSASGKDASARRP